jgi:hypothetical protein
MTETPIANIAEANEYSIVIVGGLAGMMPAGERPFARGE